MSRQRNTVLVVAVFAVAFYSFIPISSSAEYTATQEVEVSMTFQIPDDEPTGELNEIEVVADVPPEPDKDVQQPPEPEVVTPPEPEIAPTPESEVAPEPEPTPPPEPEVVDVPEPAPQDAPAVPESEGSSNADNENVSQ